MAAPPVGIDLLIFICSCRLESTAMEVQFDDIADREREARGRFVKKSCVYDTRTGDAYGALLFGRLMRRDDSTAHHPFGSYRDLWTVGETANHLAFRALLELIRWQMQTRLDQWMIEGGVLFAAGNIGEAGQIREHGPCPILPVESEQRALRWELIRCEIATNNHQSLAQFLSVSSVPSVPETAEPTFSCAPDS